MVDVLTAACGSRFSGCHYHWKCDVHSGFELLLWVGNGQSENRPQKHWSVSRWGRECCCYLATNARVSFILLVSFLYTSTIIFLWNFKWRDNAAVL